MTFYVNDITLSIDSHQYVQRKFQKYKNTDFNAEELAEVGYLPLDESAPVGYRATGYALPPVNGICQREYVDQTPEEARLQREGELSSTDVVMARMVEDMWQVLINKGLVTDADLPPAALEKLNDRRAKRAAL